MIYGRFGDEVEILGGSMVTGRVRIRYRDNGQEDDADVPFLRADDGLREIDAAVKAANHECPCYEGWPENCRVHFPDAP